MRPAARAEWGRTTGAFADPDGYVWEVAHNPGWTLDEDGAVKILIATEDLQPVERRQSPGPSNQPTFLSALAMLQKPSSAS